MKHLVIAAFAGLISLGAQAQVSETRTAKEVTGIDVKNGIEVVFTQSDTATLKVVSDSRENMDNVITEYKGGILKVYMKDPEGVAATHTLVQVFISQKNVSAFRAATGATIKMQGSLTVKDVTIDMASGGTFSAIINATGKCRIIAGSGGGFRGQVTAKELKADVTAGAYVRLWGSADTVKAYCSGGSLNAEKFICKNADVWAQKSSAVTIHTDDSITTDVDASSSITYYGDPAKTSLGINTYAIKRDNFKLSLN